MRIASTATSAARSIGYPYTPVEMAGKATVLAPSSSATRRHSVWQLASSRASSGEPE